MWIPRSEAEILSALNSGSLHETSTFDAKQSLPAPGKNKDVAHDICAMTIDGGVLLYGVGGNDRSRPDTPTPFDLKGAAERIDQVTQTAISEPPTIEIHDILTSAQPEHGYLAVLIPASPRAPHMVTLERDNRYYGRGATGNRILTEGEVARLYARRERWEQDDANLLDELIQMMPFTFEDPIERIGPMVVTIKALGGAPNLFLRAYDTEQPRDFLFNKLVPHARASDPFPDQGTPGLGEALQITRRGAEFWVLSARDEPASPYQARAELGRNGSLTYWHSPTINHHTSRLVLMERSVTRAATQAIATAGWLYEQAGYLGAASVGIALLGIAAAHGASIQHPFGDGPQYGEHEYRSHERVITTEMVRDPRSIARRLLEPLYEVVSVTGYDPFKDAN